MKRTGVFGRFHLWSGTGTVVLTALLTVSAQAQQALLHAAATHTVVRATPSRAFLVYASPEAPQASQGQAVNDDLFAGTEKFAKGASDVTEVNMDPSTLNMVGGPNANRAHDMVLSVVRTYTYDKPGMYNPADLDEYRHKLEGGDWHCSVHTRDSKSGESTDVCSRRRAPDLVENAIITASPKSLTFIHNIRKAHGQGGGLDGGVAPELGMLAPEIQLGLQSRIFAAETQAAMASLRAQLPRVQQQLQALQREMPRDLGSIREQMSRLRLEGALPSAEELRRQTGTEVLQEREQHLREQLRDQLRDLQRSAHNLP